MQKKLMIHQNTVIKNGVPLRLEADSQCRDFTQVADKAPSI
jgi:hypothetical protein